MESLVIDRPCVDQGLAGAALLGERRRTVRYEAVAYRSWVGWWEDDQFEVVAAAVVNISRGGALLQTDYEPCVGERLWFCLHSDRWVGSASATVLESTPDASGQRSVRIAFDEPCPDGLYHAAVLGLDG